MEREVENEHEEKTEGKGKRVGASAETQRAVRP